MTSSAPSGASAPSASPFAVRGVIEGFYGNPWTHEQRMDLLEFIAARGMNTFVYGPKDDPLVRRQWRDACDGEALARLAELVDRCAVVAFGVRVFGDALDMALADLTGIRVGPGRTLDLEP